MSSLTVFLLAAIIIAMEAQSCVNRNSLSSFNNVENSLNSMENSYLSKCGNGTEYSYALDKIAEHSRKIKDRFRDINDIFNKKNWKRYSGHCYLLSAETRTWENAEKRCQEMGSNLVAIEDKSENTWLQQEISNSGGSFWIGLTADEHLFYWSQNKQMPKYHQFASGYPTPSTLRCVYMYGGNWYNYNCVNTLYFICETNSCDK